MAVASREEDPRKTFMELEKKKALEQLAEIAAKLRENGLLDLLAIIADRYDEILLRRLDDKRIGNTLNLVNAVLDGIGSAATPGAENLARNLTACIIDSADPQKLLEAKPIRGVISLLEALNDPHVSKGLGVLIEYARRLGQCMEEKLKTR